MDEVIKEKKHKVIIRCDELANARSDTELLSNLAKQIGYIPLFQFMAAINHMVDMAITATTGQKAGKYWTSLPIFTPLHLLQILDLLIH